MPIYQEIDEDIAILDEPDQGVGALTLSQLASIEQGLAEANRGEFVSQSQVDAVFARYGA